MAGVLVLVFLVVPFLELYTIIQVGEVVGAVPTIALLVLLSAAGGWLMKREGLGILRRIQHQVSVGEIPGRELVDGALILVGGLLMLTPGFLSDVAGLALLVPPVRALLRRYLATRLTILALDNVPGVPTDRHGGARGPTSGGVIDV